MHPMPDGYREAVESMNRTVEIYVTRGIGIDTTAADDYDGETFDGLPMSNDLQTIDAVYELDQHWATFEADGIPTAVGNSLLAPPIQTGETELQTGVWSSPLSGSDGSMSWTIRVDLSEPHTCAFSLYTDTVSVTAGSATFTLEGVEVGTFPLDCSQGYACVPRILTWDSVEVSVFAVDSPDRHLRITEVEFGASKSLSSRTLGGEVVWISETDPLEASAPLNELDLSIVNVDGSFDVDNPDGDISMFPVGDRVRLSYTITDGGSQYTVPCGEHVIADRRQSGELLRLTCYDPRWILSTVYEPWTVPVSKSLGEALEGVMHDLSIAYDIDEDVYGMHPDSELSFGSNSSYLVDFIQIQQAYAVYCTPGRDGAVHVTSSYPSDDYGDVPASSVLAWPSPTTYSAYNYLTVRYNGGSVSRDLRTQPTSAMHQLTVSNPLMDLTRATAYLDRVQERTFSQMVSMDWAGDPAIDVGDTAGMPGKYTQDDPPEYRVVKVETTFDGALQCVVDAVR